MFDTRKRKSVQPRTIGEMRRLVSGVEAEDPNTSNMLAHIRGAKLPPGTQFHTGSALADWLFVMAYEYDVARAGHSGPGGVVSGGPGYGELHLRRGHGV